MNRLRFAFCILATAASAQTNSALSSLMHSNDGSANYAYPFDLPAARGRYQPHLMLAYNSMRSANATAGTGWALNTSYIEQAARASPNPDGSARVQYWLVLDGSRRLLVADPNASARFRPDVD